MITETSDSAELLLVSHCHSSSAVTWLAFIDQGLDNFNFTALKA